MYFDEAIDKSLPTFREAVATLPYRLVVMASVPNNPMESDGPGRLYILGHDDIAKLRDLMEMPFVEVLYFHWEDTYYTVQDGSILTFLTV